MKKTIEWYKERIGLVTKDLKKFLNLRKKDAVLKNASNDILEDLTEDQELTSEQLKILEKLTKSNSIKERVKLFGKIMDTYGVEPLLSLIPILGDIWINTIATIFLLSEWKKMWLSFGNMLKILGYQWTDATIWSIPVLWTIVDFFFKWSKRSAKIFEKHFEKLKKEAMKKWISPKAIEEIESKNKEFLKGIYQTIDSKKKK